MYMKAQVQITSDQHLDMRSYRLESGSHVVDIGSSTFHNDEITGQEHWTFSGVNLILGPDALRQVDRLISLLQEARQSIGACDHCEDGTVYDTIQTPDGERREANPCPKCRGTGQL